ncbi:cyclic pyranopterin monophosphate synthase MoaC [Bacillus massiliigorillae]|uniref:cyclic pyranopterin monophosphate synthase MoaC n=1 Tax=Bacillus massiliigorillae TaxID=1243664 RepID=UPI00039B0176|nr:cyclic pyranopterin monophosphate synthase MoaC [Bacillus massiliigorillae]
MGVFTHLHKEGRDILIDVSYRQGIVQTATALCSIKVNKDIYDQIVSSRNKQGNIFSVAKAAGVMACKNTSSKIPMYHLNPKHSVNVFFKWDLRDDSYVIHCTATVMGKDSQRVELEALTAVSTVALTVYNHLKTVDKGIFIGSTMLLNATGGSSSPDNYRQIDQYCSKIK